jgi:hypothetical protein
VSDRLARQWLSVHGEEKVSEKLDYVGARKNIKSMIGYLSAALADDYQGDTPKQEVTPHQQRLKRMQDLIASRTATQRDADKRFFLSRLDDEAKRMDFERFGWMSPQNVQGIFEFWQEIEPDIFEGIAP